MKKDIEDASLDDLEAAAGARGAFETLAWAAGVNQNWGKGADILVGAIPVAGNLNGLFDLGESVIRKTIKELGAELDPLSFWQVHRSTIVNLHAVERVARDFRGNVVLHLKDRPELLQVSQPFAHLFRQM